MVWRLSREHRQAPELILPIGLEISLNAYIGTGHTAVKQLVLQEIRVNQVENDLGGAVITGYI